MERNLSSQLTGQSPLEAQVADLTLRLGRAEEVIGYLLRAVGQMQTERGIPSPPAPQPLPNATGQCQNGFYSQTINQNVAANNVPGAHEEPSKVTSDTNYQPEAAALPVEPVTTRSIDQQIWDDMELDWDELGLLDESDPATLQTGTEAEG